MLAPDSICTAEIVEFLSVGVFFPFILGAGGVIKIALQNNYKVRNGKVA